MMRIAVIGAGCGGQAIAGFLASQGNDVNLYNRTLERIRPLVYTKEIELQGLIQLKSRLRMVTTDLAKAISGARLIMVVTNADAHYEIAKYLAPYLEDGQVIVLNPGRTFGIVEVVNTLIEYSCRADVTIAETSSLVYATRICRPGVTHIKGVKKHVPFSVIPERKACEVTALLNHCYPQFYHAQVFVTSLGNFGAVFHPAILLLNREKIQRDEIFQFYIDGATQETVEYIQHIEFERVSIGKCLGVILQSCIEWLCEQYCLKESSLYDVLHNNPCYQGLMAPKTLSMRYITEDVPTGLVPLSELGKALGVCTPFIDKLIDLASVELRYDFRKNGRNLARLGLQKYSLLHDLETTIRLENLAEFSRMERVA